MTSTYYDGAHELGAENNSFTPEDVSEDFKKNGVQDVATESEKLQKVEKKLSHSNETNIMSQKYSVPDEHLSYSELKDRIIEECAKALPKKERVMLMAKKLEDDLTLKDTICDQICTDLGHVTSEQHIRRCLPDEYKQLKKKRVAEESTGHLRNSAANDEKNVPEQQAITVGNEGYEQPFEDITRKNVEPASEIVKTLQKKIADVTQERDSLSNENKVLKEKTQPEMFQEIQERFYDEPGMIKVYRLHISLAFGSFLNGCSFSQSLT